jgi:hypothetical protein
VSAQSIPAHPLSCPIAVCKLTVTTFPKCGTTWMEQIVLLLLNGGDVEALDPLSKNSRCGA